jgi:peptide-methionine (S)-S-oxide reductase
MVEHAARRVYRDILEFFLQIHDPTTKDRQRNDIGSSYRSEIFLGTPSDTELMMIFFRET